MYTEWGRAMELYKSRDYTKAVDNVLMAWKTGSAIGPEFPETYKDNLQVTAGRIIRVSGCRSSFSHT